MDRLDLFKSPARFRFLGLFLRVLGLFKGVGMSFIDLICSIYVLSDFSLRATLAKNDQILFFNCESVKNPVDELKFHQLPLQFFSQKKSFF